MEGSVSHYNATRTFSFYFVGATDCNSPAFHRVNRVMGRPQLKPSEFQAFALTCAEDHEIIGGSSLQQASVHMDVVSHSHRAVSECSEGHAADCTAVPGQRHCWQSRESMSARQGWRTESCIPLHPAFLPHPHLCQSCGLLGDTQWHQGRMILQRGTASLSQHFPSLQKKIKKNV